MGDDKQIGYPEDGPAQGPVRHRGRTPTSIGALGEALRGLAEPASPQVARAAQATENTWRRIANQHTLLNAAQMSHRLGSTARAPGDLARRLHRTGRLLAVHRGRLLFPDFQLDERGQARPVITDLRETADRFGWSETSLIIWMVTPNGRLLGDRPVNHLDETYALIRTAEESFDVSW